MNRVTAALGVLTGKLTANWNWRGGSSSGISYDGNKLRSSLRSLYSSGADLDHAALRASARNSYWESTQARALLQRLVDNVIGTGLVVQCAPAWPLTGSTLTPDKQREFQRLAELRFHLWASSHEPDAQGKRNLFELQSFEFANELRDGESVVIIRYSGDSQRVSPISLQFLDPEQIDDSVTTYGTPDRAGLSIAAKARGNIIKNGLELSASGDLVALYLTDPETRKTTRVPARGTERRFVILPQILDLPGQVRGVGPLAAVVHELQKLTDYTVAEIEAALINAVFAAYIKPSAENDTRTDIGKLTGGVQNRTTSSTSNATAQAPEIRIDRPGMVVGSLKAGEDLASFDTKRPNVNFDAFVKSIMRSLSASMSIPVEVLEMTFSANYSASRASLILFWQVVERWRVHLVSQFLQPVYEAWFAEEVKRGRIAALGFSDSADPVVRRAWLCADWIGQSMPSIDPVKDANADDVRILQGATTRERVAQKYNGSDFYDNAARQDAERKVLPAPEAPAAPFGAKPAPAKKDDPEEKDKPEEGDE